MADLFPDHVMRQTATWAVYFANDWRMETPYQIHSSEIAPDGSPQWHPDFVRWLTKDEHRKPKNLEGFRTTRVMRRLRQKSVREYEVAYRVLVLGERLEETTRWLNERASRNGIAYPDHRPIGPHYVKKDALALLIAAVDFAREYW